MKRLNRKIARLAFSLWLVPAIAVSNGGAGVNAALADEKSAIADVTDLNKKALAAYDDLDVDEAKKLLMQALQICATQGLQTHPLRARTHLHLGVVLAGGFQDKEQALRQFQKALEAKSDITLSAALTNPEIQAIFDQAKATAGKAATPVVVKPEEPKEKPPEPTPPADKDEDEDKPVVDKPVEVPADETVEAGPPPEFKGVFHEPVPTATGGEPVELRAAVEEGLTFSRVVLAYKMEGSGSYLARDMTKQENGWYTARIPAPATRGKMVQYYIEAKSKTGQPVASNGTAVEPHTIALGGSVAVDDSELVADDEEDPFANQKSEPGEHGHAFFINVGVGTSFGYVSGSPELSPEDSKGNPIDFAGATTTGALVIAPEIGYYLSNDFLVSVQARFTLLPGLTKTVDLIDLNKDGDFKDRDEDTLLSPAIGALAVLAKATYFMGSGALRWFVSGSVGGGEIRGVVNLDGKRNDCGVPEDTGLVGSDACVDSILGGPVVVGPGGGVLFNFTSNIAATVGVNVLIGVPKLVVATDLTLGAAVGF
jgi:outer membrane biosynthesis protein TonB